MKNYLTPLGGRIDNGGWLSDLEGIFSPFSPFENNVMRTDMKEYPSYYLIEIEVPGISKSDIEITVENGYLTVSSVKTDKNDGTLGEWKYIRRERFAGATRSFYIGDVGEDDIKATYTDGLLYVNVPKKNASGTDTAKKIEIH
ncbi:MAG: Hsp20/alpha crystallin family protein [Clostridia bacterium]|nr:Hsp20/alpha crystallin family protein [Clostridia bacterium]